MSYRLNFVREEIADEVAEGLAKEELFRPLGFETAPTSQDIVRRCLETGGLFAAEVESEAGVHLMVLALVLDAKPVRFVVLPLGSDLSVDDLTASLLLFLREGFRACDVDQIVHVFPKPVPNGASVFTALGFRSVSKAPSPDVVVYALDRSDFERRVGNMGASPPTER